MDASLFRKGMSCWASGVTVMTALNKVGEEKRKLGVTISSFASVSLEPPLISFCLDRKAACLPAFKKRAPFAVNILAHAQEDYARLFSAKTAKHWDTLPHTLSPRGVPLLEGCVATILCHVETQAKSGDHLIIIGRVEDVRINPQSPAPLIHYRRQYFAVGH
jgi:flavin reductase (DIM6/NTAB) family NADH-FMN oxidoreductase RutF